MPHLHFWQTEAQMKINDEVYGTQLKVVQSCTITGRKCNCCDKLNKQNTLSQIVIFVKENMLYQKRFTSTSSGNT